MRETRFASLGKAVLIRMVGLQENYKEAKKLDRKKSGCFSCPHFEESLKNPECSACAACKTRIYSSTYINENNRYGYQHPQSLCSMKLFLYLHFCAVTKIGAIEDIYIPALSEKLEISQRNIHYCLDKLERDGYLAYGKNDEGPGHYCVLLKGYEEYFKKATEGGRGYVTLSLDCMKELLKAETINQMRLYLRLYVNIDDRKALPFSQETFLTDNKSARELSRYFPAYFKSGKVKKLINEQTKIFSFKEKDGQIRYTLRQDFYGELSKREYKEESYISIQSFIENTNEAIKDFMAYNSPASTLPPELMQQALKARGSGTAFYISIEEAELDDLSLLATQYGCEETLDTIKTLWADNPVASLAGHYGEYTRYLLEGKLCAA